jgi:hypothetical protein
MRKALWLVVLLPGAMLLLLTGVLLTSIRFVYRLAILLHIMSTYTVVSGMHRAELCSRPECLDVLRDAWEEALHG